jgi:hypothetical protein
MGVSRENVSTPGWLILVVSILALIVAIWGTVNGKLPGTAKKDKL